jgi:predicted metal-binding membrane protein
MEVGGAPTLERLLRRDRLITAVGLAVLCVLAWMYLLAGAGMGMSLADMTRLTLFPHQAAANALAMPGMDMAGMAEPPSASAATWIAAAAMWQAMMIAMMAPAAAPTILLYAQVHRHAVAEGRGERLAPTGAFAAGYLLVWLGFSIVAAGLQLELQRSGFVSAATMGSQSRWLSAVVLAAAGLYQLSPLQRMCLDHCRSPAEFLSRYWRPGAIGAVQLGMRHGVYCLGCCWLLMLLLFVGGVMNLAWIAALTALVLAEKVFPGGRWMGRAAGVAMLTWAAATLLVR